MPGKKGEGAHNKKLGIRGLGWMGTTSREATQSFSLKERICSLEANSFL